MPGIMISSQKMSPGEIAGIVIIAVIFSIIAIYLCGFGGPMPQPTEVVLAQRRARKKKMEARFKMRRERRDEYNAPILPTSITAPSDAPRTNRIVMFASLPGPGSTTNTTNNVDDDNQVNNNRPSNSNSSISSSLTSQLQNAFPPTPLLKPPSLLSPPPPARTRSPPPVMDPLTPPGVDPPISPGAINIPLTLTSSRRTSSSSVRSRLSSGAESSVGGSLGRQDAEKAELTGRDETRENDTGGHFAVGVGGGAGWGGCEVEGGGKTILVNSDTDTEKADTGMVAAASPPASASVTSARVSTTGAMVHRSEEGIIETISGTSSQSAVLVHQKAHGHGNDMHDVVSDADAEVEVGTNKDESSSVSPLST